MHNSSSVLLSGPTILKKHLAEAEKELEIFLKSMQKWRNIVKKHL